jgi:hypothetical protein
MASWLAQYNVARLVRPLDDAANAEFVAALGPINALADVSPGFVWRLQGDDGMPSSFMTMAEIDDPLVLVNYSVWEDVASLRHYVTRSGHGAYLRRRREWFERNTEAPTVCWWTPVGEIPPPAEGYRRLQHLRRHGPSAEGWLLTEPYPSPEA